MIRHVSLSFSLNPADSNHVQPQVSPLAREDAERSEGGRRKRIANESKQTQHSFGFIRLLGSSDQPFPTLT